MKLLMRQIGRLFVLSWSHSLIYRGDIALWSIASTFTPLIALAVWYTVARSGNTASDPTAILTYYILVIFIEFITRSWRGIYLVQQILDGTIMKMILRPPINLLEPITINLTTKFFQLFIPIPLFIVIAIIAPHLFSPEIYQLSNIALFLISILFAYIISFAIDFDVGLLAFWLEDAQELHSYRFLLMQVASGILIPLSVMPETIRTAFSFLPFRYMISAPAELLLGQITGQAALVLIGYQLLWSLGLLVILRLLWMFGLRHYAVPGQ